MDTAQIEDLAHLLRHTSYVLQDIAVEMRRLQGNLPKATVLDWAVEELPLAVRTRSCLKSAQIYTVRNLTERTAEQISAIRNLGKYGLSDVRSVLAEQRSDESRWRDLPCFVG